MNRLAFLFLALALVPSSCASRGSAANNFSNVRTGSSPTSSVVASPGETPLGRTSPERSVGSTGSVKATPGGPTAPSASGAVHLDRSCVHAGSAEVQGMTVHTNPATTVGYSTEYVDHSNELTNKEYTTGFGYGRAAPDGTYRAMWIVPARAPVGKATIHLIASGGPVQPTVSFTIVPPTGSCP